MAASDHEIATIVEHLLEAIDQRIKSGSVTIHYAEGVLQRVVVADVWRPRRSQNPLDRRDG